jgi:hypothetical protein
MGKTSRNTGGKIGGDLTSHTPAHNLLLPLLPSGPGGVDRSSLRGDRLDHHCSLLHAIYERSRKRRALSSLCSANARRNFMILDYSGRSNVLLLKDIIAVAPIAIPFLVTIN